MAEEKTVNPAEELKKAGEEVREGELESPDASESSSPTKGRNRKKKKNKRRYRTFPRLRPNFRPQRTRRRKVTNFIFGRRLKWKIHGVVARRT